jgi:CubicO group peptidase (beta-lactamase class C family)
LLRRWVTLAALALAAACSPAPGADDVPDAPADEPDAPADSADGPVDETAILDDAPDAPAEGRDAPDDRLDAPADEADVPVAPAFPPNPFDKGAVTLTMTGTGMAEFDDRVPAFMSEQHIPNLSLAVVKDGRLVVARVYNYVHDADDLVLEPSARFRVASITKSITAAAILKLIEEGRLALDESAFARLTALEPLPGATVDPRLALVTIRHLLTHSGGWDRDLSPDPMFRPAVIAAAVGVPSPPSAADIVRYMMGQPLDFDPGTRYVYANFGYCVLGRVIEAVTGLPYETYVREAILAPSGVARMQRGRSLFTEREPDEPYYFDLDSHDAPEATVFAAIPYPAPKPYGSFCLEAMDSHGGWIASAADLLRFITHVDARTPPDDILSAASLALWIARPALPEWATTANYYGMGWSVQPTSTDANWWHGGSLSGSRTVMVRATAGRAWAALTNARSYDADFGAALETLIWQGFAAVTAWPDGDLFAGIP